MNQKVNFGNKELSFIRSQKWSDVLKRWKQTESASEEFANIHKELGYNSWEDWRGKVIKPLHLSDLNWSLYKINKPVDTVPCFRGGPFISWIERYYPYDGLPTFLKIVSQTDTDIPERSKFSDILNNTTDMHVIGVIKDGDIFIIEGMHRCTAVALAKIRGQELKFDVYMSLAESDLDEFPIIY